MKKKVLTGALSPTGVGGRSKHPIERVKEVLSDQDYIDVMTGLKPAEKREEKDVTAIFLWIVAALMVIVFIILMIVL